MDIERYARFDQAAYDRARQRMKSAPIELTDEDFDVLGLVHPSLVTDAIEARRAAQLSRVPTSAPAPSRPETERIPAAPPETLPADAPERRTFLKLMGASLGLAGTAAGAAVATQLSGDRGYSGIVQRILAGAVMAWMVVVVVNVRRPGFGAS